MIVAKDLLDDIRALPDIECGKVARGQFTFADDYINLNHGSFGTYPACLKTIMRHWQDQGEARPDKFIRYDYPALLDVSREAIAKVLNAPVEACAFVPNATTGTNTVLRALEWQKGEVIIYFSAVYGALERTVMYITDTTPAESRKVEFSWPLSDDALCQHFLNVVQDIKARGKVPKLALFDTIVSLPGVRMPFERLTKLCREHDIYSCIDGAHSIGQIAIDMNTLDPDFYVSNCHKWLHVPRGCAVFYVPLRNQHLIRSTLPTSHGYMPKPAPDGKTIPNPLPPSMKSPYITNFEFVGTLDNTPYLCIPAALEWRKKLTWKDKRGEEAIIAHNIWVANAGADLVASKLGTEVMDNEEKSLTKCCLTNVRLPLSWSKDAGSDLTTAIKIAQWAAKTIVEQYSTFLAITIHNEAWWVRLSGQVYLTLDDFEHGANTLADICKRIEAGEWKT